MSRFWGAKRKAERKGKEENAPRTALERLALETGPPRPDGTDKLYGFENFGNTCYCNSILQPLFHCTAFREAILDYVFPTSGPPRGPAPQVLTRSWIDASVAASQTSGAHKSSAPDLAKRWHGAASAPGLPIGYGVRSEDKPNTPEWKKKQAMIKGPVLELKYDAEDAPLGPTESTLAALQDLFRALIDAESRTGVLSPQRLLRVFKSFHDSFQSPQHQDAHEFFGLMLNSVINTIEEHTKFLLPEPELAVKRGPGLPGSGWVHEIFEGVLTSETRCLVCETASRRDETFLDLSIDLDEHTSVTTCLRNFTREEMLCERNKFHCEKCGTLQEAEKRMKVKQFPRVLALHLKRFKMLDFHGNSTKLFHRVTYPALMRMFGTPEDLTFSEQLYELYAVVIHIGPQVAQGHYVSVIKTRDWGWVLFDDELVEPVDDEYVNLFFGGQEGQPCAYVLFYQQVSSEAQAAAQASSEREGGRASKVSVQTNDVLQLDARVIGVEDVAFKPNGPFTGQPGEQLVGVDGAVAPGSPDLELSVVASSPDILMTSPTGIGGSFRAWRRKDSDLLARKFMSKSKTKKTGILLPPEDDKNTTDENGVTVAAAAAAHDTELAVDDSTQSDLDKDKDSSTKDTAMSPANGGFQDIEMYVSSSAPTSSHWGALGRASKGRSLGRRSFAFLSHRDKPTKVDDSKEWAKFKESSSSSSHSNNSNSNSHNNNRNSNNSNNSKGGDSLTDSPRTSCTADLDVEAGILVCHVDTKENDKERDAANEDTVKEVDIRKGKEDELDQMGRRKNRDKRNKDEGNDRAKATNREWFPFRRKRSMGLLPFLGRDLGGLLDEQGGGGAEEGGAEEGEGK